MAKKKKSETKEVPEVTPEVSAKEKKAPQMVTVNGDRVSNAHVFKSDKSEQWFFVAKMNDVPLRAVPCSPEDCEAVMNKTASVEKMMEKYYPTKIMKRFSREDLSLPCKISGNNGEDITVHKFNAYKEKNMESQDYGKYKFYAQIGDQKMSSVATSRQLDEYFDRVKTPAQMISEVFGERLGLKSHYEQFQLPEGVSASDIKIQKNKETNRYEISVNVGGIQSIPAELSYNDRVAYFSSKTATKEQLGAKYFANELPQMVALVGTAKKKDIKEAVPSLGI